MMTPLVHGADAIEAVHDLATGQLFDHVLAPREQLCSTVVATNL